MKMTEPTQFTLPKKPRVKQKEAPPDQRKLAVIPIRAGTDERLHGATLRCLIVLCSYCNRAGLTWVSQKKLAEDMKVSQQAVSKQLRLLIQHGYVEITRKGFKGERSNTLRVIFDQSLTAEDAMALTSSIEDTRPPIIKQEQERQMEEVDREGQKRVAQLIAKAFKQPSKPKEYQMPKSGDTRAVKEVKEAMAKAKAKRSHTQPPKVVNENNPQVVNQDAPYTTSEGCINTQPLEVVQNTKGTQSIGNLKVDIDKRLKELNTVLNNSEIVELKSQGLTNAQIADALDVLLPAYQAEGLTPTSRVLADSILQLSRDVA